MRKKKKQADQNKKYDENMVTVQDLFCPDGIIENYSDLEITSDQFVRVFALYVYPRQIYVGWLDDVFNIGDVDLSVHISPVPDKEVVNKILSMETKASSQYILDKQSGNIARMPELEQQISDYQSLRNVIQLGQDKILLVTIFITIHADSTEELHRKTEQLDSILAKKNITPRVLILRQIDGLKASLPLGKHKFPKYSRDLTSLAAAACLPITVSSGGHSTGVQLGYNVFSGTPVFLNRFAGEHIIPNAHLFICGETGAGKSVSLRFLALLESYRGIKTAFVDPEGEYVRLAKRVGGQVISLRPGRFSGINPLDVESEEEEDGSYTVNVQSKIEDVQVLISSVFRYYSNEGLGIQEVAFLEEAILEEYKSRGITSNPESLYDNGIKKMMPTLSSIHKRLKSKPGTEKLVNGMTPLLKGGSVGMFDGQSTVKLENEPMVDFDLHWLGGDFSKFVGIQSILAWLWQKFAQKGGKKVPKCVAIDEAWMFLRYLGSASYLEILGRRGRKHGCGLTIATQRFSEFAKSDEGQAVIESCASILVLRQEEHAANAVIDYFHLSEGCLDLILPPAGGGQGILRISGNVTAIQVNPAPFEWDLVQTYLAGDKEV